MILEEPVPSVTALGTQVLCLCTNNPTLPSGTLIEKKKKPAATHFYTLGVHCQSNGWQVSRETSIDINGSCETKLLSPPGKLIP